MITLEGLSKVYAGGGQPALDDVSLTVPDGAIYGILGRSGAGKSTLIRCLNLLERPTSGRILMQGVDITTLNHRELRTHRQRTGMVFQHFNLIHARNVADNIAVPLEIAGQTREVRQQRIAQLLELVGLSDEATSALDSETTASVLALLMDINRKLGVTIVLITHQLEVVKAICDHAALLENGRLIESGPLSELLVSPYSRLRRALLPGDIAEKAFLQRIGVSGRVLCEVA